MLISRRILYLPEESDEGSTARQNKPAKIAVQARA